MEGAGPRVQGRTLLVLPGLGGWGGGGVGVGGGGAKGPGPDRLGFRPFRPGLGGGEGGGGGGQGSWAGPAWFLLYFKKHESDGDVNIILLRNMTVIRMLLRSMTVMGMLI